MRQSPADYVGYGVATDTCHFPLKLDLDKDAAHMTTSEITRPCNTTDQTLNAELDEQPARCITHCYEYKNRNVKVAQDTSNMPNTICSQTPHYLLGMIRIQSVMSRTHTRTFVPAYI